MIRMASNTLTLISFPGKTPLKRGGEMVFGICETSRLEQMDLR